jgi:YD repeat-containing protein
VFPKAYLKTIQVGKNNIIDTDGQKIEYEYNEQGYPTKAVSSDRTTIYEYY